MSNYYRALNEDFGNNTESGKTMKKDKQFCCDECGGDHIEWQVWADEYDVVSDGDGTRDVWCDDCEEHHKSVLKDDYKKKTDTEPTHAEIMQYIENNPVGPGGYTNSGTPTDETYEDAIRELQTNKGE